MKKVSILLSLYKPNIDYLREQLISINNQNYPEIELLVWNDCPAEDIDQELFKECLVDIPVKFFDEKVNLGYIKAFEKLTLLADGEYVSYCDQDDIWEFEKISKCVEAIETDGSLAAVCDKSIIDHNGNFVCESVRHNSKNPSDTWNTGDNITSRAVFRCYSTGMAILAKREAVLQFVPFSSNTGHDKWLMLCLSAKGKISYVDIPLIRYRRYGKNVTGTLNEIETKKDYYEKRCEFSKRLIEDFAIKFPDYPELQKIRDCNKARLKGDIFGIWKHRNFIPETYKFEILLSICPSFVFKMAKKYLFR